MKQDTTHSRRGALFSMALGVLVLSFELRAQTQSDIVAVRVWAHKDYTRVTIESDAHLQASHTSVANPPRLAVDLNGVIVSDTLRQLVARIKPEDPYIAGVRVAQYTPSTVRLVFDLKTDCNNEVFTLPPIAGLYKHRLVLDVRPLQAIDPLETLVAQIGNAANKDPLGDLIAQRQNKPATAPSAAPNPASAKAAQRLVLIALDPGHGGEDPGAIGPKGTREKDIVLQVGKLVQARLNNAANIPAPLAKALSDLSFKAFLTRDADYFVPLATRVEKAERAKADLFVSIHADAFTVPTAKGASVFALSDKGASSVSAKWLANKENQSDAIGGIHIKAKDKTVKLALLDMGTTAQIKDSLKVGAAVLGEFGQIGNLHKTRVEQASFAVLKAPQIPSVLVETAFISNPDEEERLRNVQYQQKIADALVRGIYAYFAKHPPLSKKNA